MTLFKTTFVIVLLFVYLPFLSHATAQTVVQETLEMDSVHINATRYQVEDRYQPLKLNRFTSEDIELYRGGSISDILASEGALLIRTYGMGGLATASPRGYNPSRTQVLWNGFPINDPMNGTVDFSLIPAAFIERMEVIPGNSSSAFGNRAAGGTINLESRRRERQVSVWQSLGSFGKNIQGASGGWYQKGWHGNLMLQRENSDNDFNYSTESGRERRSHNAVHGLHGFTEAGYTGDNFSYNSSLWVYDVENQIPGSLDFPSESAVQTDQSLKWINRFLFESENSSVDVNLLFGKTDQTYIDDAFGINSRNRNRQISADLSWMFSGIDGLDITQALALSHTGAKAVDFDGNPSQWIVSYQLNPHYKAGERVRLFGGLRYDYYETAGNAVSASLGFNTELIKQALILRGQVSRNFVAPTFNDLYWVPSGNPDLKPEINRKADLGILHTINRSLWSIESDFTLFSGFQKQGILWTFDSDQGYYRAQNIDEILTRGIELTSTQTLNLNSLTSFKSGFSINYNRSTVEADQFDDNRTVGKQLVYVPEWQLATQFSAKHRAARAGLNIVWTDRRYSSQDHSATADPMKAYTVSSAYMQISLNGKSLKLNLTARVENLLNRDFQVIYGYPMPGRHFLMTARFGTGSF